MESVVLQSKSALNKCDTLIPPEWSTYSSLALWMMLSVSSSPFYLQKPGSVDVAAETDLLDLTESCSPLCPAASWQFWTSSHLLPSDSGSALSCPACWCCHSGDSASHSQEQNSVRHQKILFYKWWNYRIKYLSKSCICFGFILCILPCRYYLKCYIFVSQLEALNIPYTVQSFLSTPKEGLVKGLWKNHSHEPQVTRNMRSLLELQVKTYLWCSLCVLQAVQLVADLCLEYQVYDPQLWNSLLQKLLGFNLVSRTHRKIFEKHLDWLCISIFLFLKVNFTRIYCALQISHLQGVLEAVVAVPALWEVTLHFFAFNVRNEDKWPHSII